MQVNLVKADHGERAAVAHLLGLPSGNRKMPAVSRLEQMVTISNDLPPRCQLLDLLLPCCTPYTGGSPVLRPLWAEEAMHRAHGLMRLVGIKHRREKHAAHDRLTARLECALATHLATSFRSLDIITDNAEMPCASVLRNVVADLVALFGDDVVVRMQVEHLMLPAYKRRALVLAAAELTTNALLHAFPRRGSGRIDLVLERRGAACAALSVRDDGIGFARGRPNLRDGVAAGLAGLLEAELVYARSASTTAAVIVFPLANAPADSKPAPSHSGRSKIRTGCGGT